MKFVLATHNQHKVVELRQLLAQSLSAFETGAAELLAYGGPEPIEDGTSFAENALIKARAANQHTGLPAIADDSGLAVEMLGGSPGIFSARWSGQKDDAANRQLVLAQLRDVRAEHRVASFVCTMALVDGDDEITCTGVWLGSLAFEPRGVNGFGYDPIFIPQGFDQTAAELAPEIKNQFSHRSLAVSQLVSVLASRF